MATDLFELALKITERGGAEAVRSLKAVEDTGKRTTTSLVGLGDAFDKNTRLIESSRVKFDAWQRQLTQNANAAASNVTQVNSMAVAQDKANFNANRLRGGLSALTSQVVGLNPQVASLASILGEFALGPAIAPILAGIAAIAFAYDKLTASVRATKKASDDAIASIQKMLHERALGPDFALKDNIDAINKQIASQKEVLAGAMKIPEAVGMKQLIASTKEEIKALEKMRDAGASLLIARAIERADAAMAAFGKTTTATTVQLREQKAVVDHTTPIQGPHIINTPTREIHPFPSGDMPLVSPKSIVPIDDLIAQESEAFKRIAQATLDLVAGISGEIQQGIAQTLGDAIFNGFSAAFNGEGILNSLKAFGKTILAGLGHLFAQMGQTFIEYGVIMTLARHGLFNPITAGPTAIAIGVALEALGAALGAIGNRGVESSASPSSGNFGAPSEEITRFKFIDRSGNFVNIEPKTPIHFTVIGTNDPKAQRDIKEIVEKANRRAA